MHRAAEARIVALDEDLVEWPGDDRAARPVPESSLPYCGCDTCRVRETLAAAFEWLEGARS